jgi:hypothetical protein
MMTCRTAPLALRALAARARAALPRLLPRISPLHAAAPALSPRASRCRSRAGAARLRHCEALSAVEPYDIRRAPDQQARLCFPDEVLRAALRLSAADEDLPPSFFRCTRTAQLLRTAAPDAAGVAPAAAALRARLLRLLDALEAACPAVLRGADGAAIESDALLAPERNKALLKRIQASMHHCFRRVNAVATFAACVPDSDWAQPPEMWRPSSSTKCACCDARCDASLQHLFLVPLADASVALLQHDRAAAFVPGSSGGHALRCAAMPVRRL